MKQDLKTVTDENGAIFELGASLGKGGQGEVFRVKGGKQVVKLVYSKNDERMRRQFASVKRVDLRGIHVAKPLALLKRPLVGYIAEFLDGMIPISTLMSPGKSVLEWHIETGGLRRRLRLLAHLGEVLMALHAKGLIYADVSHHNVFVSEDLDFHEVWLIDLDNLTSESDPANTIYTPGFAAPELIRGHSGNTSLTDAWAFAVLVWQVLTLNHPFIGDMVNDGEPELEEQAFRAEVPWVGHSSDDSNLASTGLPAELMFGQKLMELAQRMFEVSVDDKLRRPGIAEWVEMLHATADQTIRCKGCKGSYLVNQAECPWCDEQRPETYRIFLHRWDASKRKVSDFKLGRLALSISEPLTLTERVTLAKSGPQARRPHVTILKVERGYQIIPESDAPIWVMDPNTKEEFEVKKRGQTVGEGGWLVFFDSTDRDQRVAILGAK